MEPLQCVLQATGLLQGVGIGITQSQHPRLPGATHQRRELEHPQRGVELPESSIVVANGSTRVECRLPAGTSYGVWPRLSLVGVDEFVVLLDERDPSSGDLAPVAAAYGHEAATFVRAGR